MTDSEKLDLILSKMQGMETGMQGMETKMQTMETGMQDMETKMQTMESNLLEVKKKVTNIDLTLEIEIRVNMLESELRRIKERLDQIA